MPAAYVPPGGLSMRAMRSLRAVWVECEGNRMGQPGERSAGNAHRTAIIIPPAVGSGRLLASPFSFAVSVSVVHDATGQSRSLPNSS